ncbi:hypothetical protein ABID58_006351 [Bradyrhizobium sp. S3.2.6]|uniref:hypothetical protein n=1 Tax=Bradyrhizobium sp. S3.2.6 TaxID=3156428 RepID=UPI003393A246
MSDGTTVYVDCYRDGKLIASYDFLVPHVFDPRRMRGPSDEELIGQAKDNPSNLMVANPPYTGITFKVRR